MSEGLDVIVVDDDPGVCQVITEIIERFYAWGEVIAFTDTDQAISYCQNRETGVAIFVLDVFLGSSSGLASEKSHTGHPVLSFFEFFHLFACYCFKSLNNHITIIRI